MKILVFDTETTGLPVRGSSIYELNKWPHIIQLSYILYDISKNEVLVEKDEYIKLNPTVTIEPESIAIHKITREILDEKGIHIKSALSTFNKYMRSCDIVVGHNISFDKRMIFVECIRQKMDQQFTNFENNIQKHKPEYCTMKNTTELCQLTKTNAVNKTYNKYPKLVELHEKLFPDKKAPQNLHNSMVDILYTLKCYIKIITNEDITEKNAQIELLFAKFQ